jgi:hypothetical protein
MTDTRPAEGPDREALVERLLRSRLSMGFHTDRWNDEDWQRKFWNEALDLALLPTPPAPGDGEGLRAEVERLWTDLPDRCPCNYASGGPEQECPEHGDVRLYAEQVRRLTAALAARDTSGEGLRAEVERLRTYHVRVPEMNGTFLRRDDVIAALAARDLR